MGKTKGSTDEMLALRKKGLSNKEIARKLGCSYSTVRLRIGAQPEEATNTGKVTNEELLALREQGLTNAEIAEKVGIAQRTVLDRIGKQPDSYNKNLRSDVSNEEILALKEQGLNYKQIADKVGMSAPAVSRRVLISKSESAPESASTPAPAPTEAPVAPVEPVKVEIPTPAPKPAPEPILAAIPTGLFEFASVSNWAAMLYQLSQLALPESWRFKNPSREYKYPETAILENYINTVFSLRATEYNTRTDIDPDRIMYLHNGVCFFHTGLYSRNYKGIFAYFEHQHNPVYRTDWCLKGFMSETAPVFAKIARMPEHREIESRYMLPFDPALKIKVNIDHIVYKAENAQRLPESIRNAWNATLLIEMAIEMARKQALVVPQAIIPSPRLGRACYLLPLYLTNPDSPDLVAVLEEIDGYYNCPTCLTPEMAYLTARVNSGKPAVEWLTELVVPIKPK